MSEIETALDQQGRLLHIRAEKILEPLLIAQGREPSAYTGDEYATAYNAAQRELAHGPVANLDKPDAEDESVATASTKNAIREALGELGFQRPAQPTEGALYHRAREILVEQGIDGKFTEDEFNAAMRIAISELSAEQVADLAGEMNLAPGAVDPVAFEEKLSAAVDNGAILASGKAGWRSIFAADAKRAVGLLNVLTVTTSDDSPIFATKALREAAARATSEDGVGPDSDSLLLSVEANRQLAAMGYDVGEDGTLPENVTDDVYEKALRAAEDELQTGRFDSRERGRSPSNPRDSRGEDRTS